MSQLLFSFGLVLLAGYLLGSVNCAVLLSTLLYHDDVRGHGSGNAGTTNMLRTFGVKAAALTFVGDLLKGVLAVAAARLICGLFGAPLLAAQGGRAVYLAGIAAVLGHMFPLYFRFQGGKGVATGLGAVWAIAPALFGVVACVGFPLAGITGYVSVGSIVGALLYPAAVYLRMRRYNIFDWPEFLLATALALLVLYNHRENIRRLLSGSENKFYKKKA